MRGAEKMRVLDLFSGIGGFSRGLEMSGGFETVAFCEIDPWARAVLKQHWHHVPCYPDVTELTAERLRDDGITVDAICGGFPCQDASIANTDGDGAKGSRTILYREMCRLARELGCRIMLMENVPNLLNRGFGDVLGALAEIGFDAEWQCISARDIGANHERDRLWIMAYPKCQGRERPEPFRGSLGRAKASLAQHHDKVIGGWLSVVDRQRGLRSEHGLSVGMERRRLHALGNAIVPGIAQLIGRAILASTTAPQAMERNG